MIYIPDHVARGLANILSQFRNAGRLRAFAEAILEEVQEAEDALADLAVALTVDGANGAQLDLMGALLGERRDALDDLWYRRFIRARAQIRRCQGTPEEVTAIAATITQGPVTYSPAYPAGYRLNVAPSPALTDVLRARLKARILEATPAGVGVDITETPATPPPFTFGVAGGGFNQGHLTSVY